MESIMQSINLDQIRNQTEEKYFGSQIQSEKYIPYENFTYNEAVNLRNKYFWIGDLIFTKAIISLFEYTLAHQPMLNYDFNNFLNYKLIDIKKLQKFQTEEEKHYLDYKNIKEIDFNSQNVLIEKNFENRYKKVNKIYEKLANSILFVEEVNNLKQLDSIIYFTHNLINYDLLTPYDAVKENIWIYLNIISDFALKRLEKIKNGEADFNATDYNIELQRLRNRLGDPNSFKLGLNFDNNISLLRKFEAKQNYLKSVKMNLNTNNLSNINQTQHPISIKDCTILGETNIANEMDPILIKDRESLDVNKNQIKINEEQLIDIYDNRVNFDVYVEFIIYTIQCDYIAQKWNTLANLIQKFNYMTNDHFCEFTLSFLIEAQNKLYDKASENTKNKKLEIEQRRKLLEIYQMEALIIRKEEELRGLENSELKSKKKALKVFASNLIGIYKKSIQIMKKRQENFMLIQALYEMSLVLYSDGDVIIFYLKFFVYNFFLLKSYLKKNLFDLTVI